MPFVVGETVGPYRVMEQLGQGGMATVFKAYHPSLDRFVAIKALHPAFTADSNFLARFQREAQVVARLEHPNIVPIYDFSEHQNHPYLVMKYIEGETLKARLTRGPLSEEDFKQIVIAVGSALEYAHNQGILHRDVKPSNVLLASDQQIYLADFGLARIAQAGQSTLSSDVMLGTPQYISPEQGMGKKDLGVATDIYSFGVMVYEILVGQVPFSADTPFAIIHDHIYTPLPLPRTLNPEISETVENVLLKALAKEPGDRYGDVPAMVAGLIAAKARPKPEVIERAAPEVPVREASRPPAETSWPAPDAEAGATVGEPHPDQKPLPSLDRLDLPEPAAKRRGGWRWWYLVPIFALVCLCTLVIAGALNDGGGVTPGAGPAEIPSLPVSTASTPQQDRTALALALEQVTQNPDDPFAHLNLANAYFEVGDFQNAQSSLETAQQLAGENPDFFIAAGDVLLDREFWLMAAAMYIRALDRIPGRPPQTLRDKAQMSIYLAAGDAEARTLLASRDQVITRDNLFFEVVRARFQLYQGSVEIAQEAVSGLLSSEPGYAPASLLQAEILLNSDNPESAPGILQELVESEVDPAWVPLLARVYLEGLDSVP